MWQVLFVFLYDVDIIILSVSNCILLLFETVAITDVGVLAECLFGGGVGILLLGLCFSLILEMGFLLSSALLVCLTLTTSGFASHRLYDYELNWQPPN